MIEEREGKASTKGKVNKTIQWIHIDDPQKPVPGEYERGGKIRKSSTQSDFILLANVAQGTGRFKSVEIGIYFLDSDEFKVNGAMGGDMTPTHWAYYPDAP